MKTCRQIRYENARELVLKDGPAAFARKVTEANPEERQMVAAQVNQFAGPNPTRGIGDDIARRIENAYGLEEGWLDHEWSDESKTINNGQNAPLSDEAKSLILCVERLDRLGDLARKTFAYHTGLLLLSSAAAELQTGSVRSQMLAEVERLLGPAQSDSTGAINEGKHK